MAMLAIPVSKDVSRLFKDLEFEEDFERHEPDHITLFYFGDNLSIHKIIKIIPVIYEFSSQMSPLELSCSKITTFPEGKNGYPVIVEIKSKQLIDLRENIKKAFEKKNIAYDNTFEYRPHLTLGYANGKRSKKISTFKWPVSEISLYGGDTDDTKLFINFPLNLGKTSMNTIGEGIFKSSKKSEPPKEPISKKKQLKIIDLLKKKIKDHKVVKEMFDEYGVDIEEIDLIPMGFADLDVSARTDHGTILLNMKSLEDGSCLNDDHYLVHEITHFLQQTTGNGPTKGGDEDYLDNEYEQEGFQNQTAYIADTKGEEVAEQYVEQVMNKHDVPNEEREEKRDELLGVD